MRIGLEARSLAALAVVVYVGCKRSPTLDSYPVTLGSTKTSSRETSGPDQASPQFPAPAASRYSKPIKHRVFPERGQGFLALGFIPPAGDRILSSGTDNVARVWDAGTGRVLQRYSGKSFRFNCAAFHRDGRRVLTGGDTARLWEISSGATVRVFPGQDGVRAVALSPDQRTAATAGIDASIVVWDLETAHVRRRFEQADGPVGYLDDHRIAWVQDDLKLCRAEVDGTSPPTCNDIDFGRIGPASISNRLVIAGDSSGTMGTWDVSTGDLTRQWSAHRAAVNALDYLPTKALAISVSPDQVVRVWNVDNGKEVAHLGGTPGIDVTVSLSSDGGRAVFGTEDGAIHVWEIPPRI